MRAADPRREWVELYTPKLVTTLREGYGPAALRADAVAGLTVAIVALPLSMAIAIASGVPPANGLFAAIVGGFLVSALGGSRFQIGGPAGAFIVLIAATVQRHGIDGMLTATLLSGLMLLALGASGLGTFIKYIPYPVTVGFTAGIAVIILASQLRELLGLTLAGAEPGPIIAKLAALAAALPTVNLAAAALAGITVALILGLRRFRPTWPGFLIAVVVASVASAGLGLPVNTIASRFGGIPSGLPWPSLPDLSAGRITAVLPDALSFALLGAIESLLSAVVADSMTGRRHRSNSELVAQGVANMAAACFAAMPVTGTIARTATNVRAGARGPVSGMLHAAFLLAFMVLAAPLAGFVPLAALAGILAVVAWNMAERHAIAALLRASRGDALVLAATFLVTVLRDLSEGILVGFCLGALLFLHRMAGAVTVQAGAAGGAGLADEPDAAHPRSAYDPGEARRRDIVVYRISGAFFFGAAAAVGRVLDRVAVQPRAIILDLAAVPVLDSTAAATIEGFARKARRRGTQLYVAGAAPSVRRMLIANGVKRPLARFRPSIADARQAAEAALSDPRPLA